MKIIIMVIPDEKIYENKYEKKLIEKAISGLVVFARYISAPIALRYGTS